MKASVHRAYLFEWGQVRKALRAAGVPSKECDARRHAIHVEVLGYDKSSTKLNDDETNAVMKRLRELSGSLNCTDYAHGSRMWVIRELCGQLGKTDAYAQGIADQMDCEGRLLTGPLRRPRGQTPGERAMQDWEADLHRTTTPHRRLLRELKPEELDKVIIALRQHVKDGVITEPEPEEAVHPF